YREASRLASGNHRWYLAGNAHALYLATGQEREAQAYEEQIARESGMAYFADEIESERFRSDPGQQERVLTTACSSYIVSLFGDDTCLRAMRVVFEAVESADGQLRTAMQTAAAKGMQELLPYEEQHRPEMRRVLQAWFDAGMTSAEALATLAHMDRERYDRSLTAE